MRRAQNLLIGVGMLINSMVSGSTLAAASERSESPQALKVKFQQGRVVLSASINGEGPFNVLLDSACTIPTLHPIVMDQLKKEPSGTVRIVGIGGEERAPTYRDIAFKFGETSYSPRRVAVIPSEREHSRRWRDGVIGSGFLRNNVVEVIPAESLVKLYPPGNFVYAGNGVEVPFEFRAEIPVVKGSLVLGTNVLEGDYEIDTGCDSGMCLGSHYVKAHDLASKLGRKQSEKFGVGGSVQTRDARMPEFKLGSVVLKDIQGDLFMEGSPVDEPLAGHIGMRAFSGRKVIIDYPRKRLIVE